MKAKYRKFDLSIWALGFGYFVFYTPYSGLTKAITNGLLPGMTRPLSGFELLPLSVAATVVGIYGFITVMGWWKYARHRNVLGLSLPMPTWQTCLSGLCMGTIIATTTLAFSFGGASILFMLILLRGGILIIGPIVDGLEGRRVRWFSWAAMSISLLSLLVAFADVHNYELRLLAVLDIAAYLAAYFFRLRIMTTLAKSTDHDMTLRYFVEEQMIATPALLAVLLLLAAVGSGDMLSGFRWGVMHIWQTNSVLPAILVGASYAALMVCTTFIFLDRRENTFCIPMHCGSSMMSGVVASIALAYLYHQNAPSTAQYASTGMIAMALAFLSPLHHIKDKIANAMAEGRLRLLVLIARAAGKLLVASSSRIARANEKANGPLEALRRVFLFVCSGNTCRSPMAAAIGNAEIAARLKIPFDELYAAPVRAISAGISARHGAPITAEAAAALNELNIPVPAHTSTLLTPEMVDQAEMVFCMSKSHRDAVIGLLPLAESKTHCLDPEGDIEDPIGASAEVYTRCAERIRSLVQWRLTEAGITA